jgi:hypothetical protein
MCKRSKLCNKELQHRPWYVFAWTDRNFNLNRNLNHTSKAGWVE